MYVRNGMKQHEVVSPYPFNIALEQGFENFSAGVLSYVL
jgi:hypothetical protein